MKIISRHQTLFFFMLTIGIAWVIWIPAAIAKLNGSDSLLAPSSLGSLARWTPGLVAVFLTANLATILMGYLMLAAAVCLGPIRQAGKNLFLADLVYWLALFGLIADPLNLSIGPFFYGGDVNGIAVGLEVNRLAIQAVFLVVFLVNRELVAQKLLPAYGIQTSHPLFKPWLKGRVSPAV
jgi:hypothetical protein